jgi:hypothetical protein
MKSVTLNLLWFSISIPAPLEDEMAPQNVSFIDSSAEDEPERYTPLFQTLLQNVQNINFYFYLEIQS